MIPLLLLLLAPRLALVNHALTPGALRLDAHGQPWTLTQICATAWSHVPRHDSAALKTRVYAAYGIPPALRHLYVIDHLISLEVGGADGVMTNLWPERRVPSYAKDLVEGQLHRDICAQPPRLTLKAAQQQMRAWATE